MLVCLEEKPTNTLAMAEMAGARLEEWARYCFLLIFPSNQFQFQSYDALLLLLLIY